MADDNPLRSVIRAKKAEAQDKLRNGGGVTPEDNAWLSLAILELIEDAEEAQAERRRAQQLLYDTCEARLAYLRGDWWRTRVRDRLLTTAITLIILIVAWGAVQVIQSGFTFP